MKAETASKLDPAPSRFLKNTDYRVLAWLVLLTAPAFWLLGFGAAHIPYVIWPQYVEGEGQEPFWFSAISTALFLAVVWVPGWLAVRFGKRAVAAGYRNTRVAVWLGTAWVLGNVAILVVSFLIMLASS